MAAAAAHATKAAAAAPGSAKTGAAAHAAKAASAETASAGRPRPAGRTRSTRAAVETAAGAEVIVRAAGRTGAPVPTPCAEPAKRPPEPAEGVAERGDKDKENCDEQDDISKQGENAADKAFPTITGGKVTNVVIDASGETPELGGKAAETLSASLLAAGSTVGVDAVSGSTMTSDAVFAAMNDCLAQAAQ